MEATGRKASGTVNTAEDSMLVTTIPYDKGWKAKIDGKPVKVSNFKDAFLMIKFQQVNILSLSVTCLKDLR